LDRDVKKRESPSDPDAPPTDEELAEAEALREALADPSRANAPAELARAVALAHAPRPLPAEEHREIVQAGIARGEARRKDGARGVARPSPGASPATRPRWRRAPLGIGIGAALAAAAAVALLLSRAPSATDAERAPLASAEPLAPLRSTQPLFREPFARTGGESARIDRIASARAADLRDNRFAAWGVR
jgi:hypothetical protein